MQKMHNPNYNTTLKEKNPLNFQKKLKYPLYKGYFNFSEFIINRSKLPHQQVNLYHLYHI